MRHLITDLYLITDSNDNLVDPYGYIFTDKRDASIHMTNNWDKKTQKEDGIKVSKLSDLLGLT